MESPNTIHNILLIGPPNVGETRVARKCSWVNGNYIDGPQVYIPTITTSTVLFYPYKFQRKEKIF